MVVWSTFVLLESPYSSSFSLMMTHPVNLVGYNCRHYWPLGYLNFLSAEYLVSGTSYEVIRGIRQVHPPFQASHLLQQTKHALNHLLPPYQ